MQAFHMCSFFCVNYRHITWLYFLKFLQNMPLISFSEKNYCTGDSVADVMDCLPFLEKESVFILQAFMSFV